MKVVHMAWCENAGMHCAIIMHRAAYAHSMHSCTVRLCSFVTAHSSSYLIGARSAARLLLHNICNVHHLQAHALHLHSRHFAGGAQET